MSPRFFLRTAAVAVLGLLTAACAPEYVPGGNQSAEAPDRATLAEVRATIAERLPGVDPSGVRLADAAGLYEVQHGQTYGYVTADGKYLIEGDLVELATGESLTENKRKAYRVAQLDAFGTDKMIVFGPADAKYTVTVFTDIDCGYCRKLHREVEEYNKRGIAIRYAFYPRSGPGSESFRKAETVWCSADQKAAMTMAKQGVPLPPTEQCKNPVAQEWALGSELGLRGTPMLILPDGEVVNGYVPAPALAERLETLERG